MLSNVKMFLPFSNKGLLEKIKSEDPIIQGHSSLEFQRRVKLWQIKTK